MKHRIKWGIPALLLVFVLFTAGCDINGKKSIDAALDESPLDGTWKDASNNRLTFSGGKIALVTSGGTNLLPDWEVTYSLTPRSVGSYDIKLIVKENSGDVTKLAGTVAYDGPTTGTFPAPAEIVISGTSTPIDGNYEKQ
jgi:hypothetical protein